MLTLWPPVSRWPQSRRLPLGSPQCFPVMNTDFEVRPPLLCRVLFSPSVSHCRCSDGWLILHTRGGEKAIRMEAVTSTRWRAVWLVGSLLLRWPGRGGPVGVGLETRAYALNPA